MDTLLLKNETDMAKKNIMFNFSVQWNFLTFKLRF